MEKMVTMLHVQCTQDQTESIQQQIIDLLRTQVIAEGFVETATDATSVDRVIRIGAPLEAGWIPIDGSLTRSFGSEALQICGQGISRALMTNVIVAFVFEYDLLELWLYCAGNLVDHYASDPSEVSPSLPRRRWKEIKGNAEAWADVLLPNGDSTVLKKLFRTRPIAADDAFAAIAAQLGLNPQHWNGLTDTDTIIPLKFRSTYVPHPQTSLQGEPHLLWGSHTSGIESIVGQPFELTWIVRPVGGVSDGIVIDLQGTALEQGLLQLQALSTYIHHDEQRFEQMITIESDTSASMHVEFANYAIPAGKVGAIIPLEAWNWREAIKAQWQDVIVFKLTGIVRAIGRGSLTIQTYPQAGSPTTGTILDLPCVLHSIPPLSPRIQRFVANTTKKALTGYIFDLYTPRILQAHIVLALTPQANTAFLAAFEQWHTLLESYYPHGYYSLITAAERYPFLRRTRLRTRTLPAGKRWNQLRPTLLATSSILLQREVPLSIRQISPNDWLFFRGMSGGVLERDSIFLHETDEAITPQISLWVDLYTIPKEHHAELITQLTAIAESLFTTHQGIQAYLAQWNTIPDHLESTSYELIGGVHGQTTLSQTWCSKFLRAVTDRMWLGSALLARIENPDALSDHGVIQPMGDGIRIDVESIPQLHALETMLTSLIPTSADWSQAVDGIYK